MNNIQTPSYLSIKKFFFVLITITMGYIVIKSTQTLISKNEMEILNNVFFDSLIFIAWSLFWLSRTFKNRLFGEFKSTLTAPINKKWYLETPLLFLLNFIFSLAALIFISEILLALFPSLEAAFSPSLMPDNEVIASIAVIFMAMKAVLISPILEEFLFRGVFFSHLKTYYSPVKAMIIVSILFAAFHLDPVGAFVFSMSACILTAKYKSLRPSIAMHMTQNFICHLPKLITLGTVVPISHYRFNSVQLLILLSIVVITGTLFAVYVKNNLKFFISESHPTTKKPLI